MSTEIIKQIMEHTGASRTTAYTWVKSGKIPAEKCIQIEKGTNCTTTRYDLRPDLFSYNHLDTLLSDCLINHFKGESELAISVMTYVKLRQPDLYDLILNQIKETKLGEEYISNMALYGHHHAKNSNR